MNDDGFPLCLFSAWKYRTFSLMLLQLRLNRGRTWPLSLTKGYRRFRRNILNIINILLLLRWSSCFWTWFGKHFYLSTLEMVVIFPSHKGFVSSRCDLWPLLKPCLECFCDYSVGVAYILLVSLQQDGFFWNITALWDPTLVSVLLISRHDTFFFLILTSFN